MAAERAQAACTPGSAGPRDFVCVGAIGATSLPAARTVAMTGATSTGYMYLAPAAHGNLGFSMDSRSSITAAAAPLTSDGLTLITSAGSITTATPSGSGINGAISASAGAAILAKTTGAGSSISLITGSGGVLSGSNGIIAQTDNDGAINLTLGAKVTSTIGAAIQATTADGAINIGASSALSGGMAGVVATGTGAGPIVINASGAISAATGYAVQATAGGAGNITLNLNGAMTGALGVNAQSGGGDVTVNATGKITSPFDAVSASTTGVGAVTVNTGGAIASSAGNGVWATTVDGVATVRVGAGGISAARNGVFADATGLGSTYVAVHGNIAGGETSGINASSKAAVLEIDLDAGVFVTGGMAAVRASTQSGVATVNNAGTITGAQYGLVIDSGTGATVVTNAGTIQSTGAAANNVMSGATLIANAGVIKGRILDSGMTTLNNDGAWSNAGDSTLSYLNNNGTLSLGPATGAPSTIRVSGDAAFGPNSYYNARITATGLNDAILVAGQTSVNGGVVNISGSSGNYARGTKYTLLNSTGGITGSGFTTVISNIPSLAGVLTFDSNNMYLTLLSRDFTMLALNRNQYAVAGAVWAGSSVLTSGPAANLLLGLNALPNAAIPGALTQLSGDGVVTAADNAALQAGHIFASVLDDQQSQWRSGAGGAVNSITLREYAYAPTYVDGRKWPVSRQQAAPAPVPGQRTWRIWATGFGGQEKLSGDQSAGSSNQSAVSVGGAMGVDYQIGAKGLIGVGIGYSGNTFQATSTSVNGTSNGLHIGLYGGYQVGPFYGSASIAYGGYTNHVKRTVGFANIGETETSNYSSTEVRTRLEVGRRVIFESMAITPFTAIEVAHISSKPFVESSEFGISRNSANLAFAGQGLYSVPTFIGLRAEARFEAAGAIVNPWVSIAWRHEWSASRTQTAALVSMPVASFVAIGARPAYDALQLKVGASVQVTRAASIYASFEGEITSKNPVYAGRGGVRFGW